MEPVRRLCLRIALGLTLLALASVKFVAIAQNYPVLAQRDHLIHFLTYGQLAWIVAFLELALGIGCCLPLRYTLLGGALCWLSGNYLLYHAAYAWFGVPRPCPCVGFIGEWIGLTRNQEVQLAVVLAFFLFAGGVSMLLIKGNSAHDVASPL